MVKKIIGGWYRKMLAGNTEIKEFSTISIDDTVGEKVYLAAGDLLIDITKNQGMLGLEPLTFGVWIESPENRTVLGEVKEYTIYFRKEAQPDPRQVGHNAMAVAQLKYFDRIDDERGTLFLMQITESHIYHVHSLRALLIYRKFYKKPNLSFDKLKSVVTAYSYPRRVRVISFQEGNDYNYIFPMDLLGDIRQSGRYLLGMRHSNSVLQKIMNVRKIVVADFPPALKPMIYQLGRNHSAAPPALDQLPFSVVKTKKFGFYVPE